MCVIIRGVTCDYHVYHQLEENRSSFMIFIGIGIVSVHPVVARSS